MSIYDLSIEQVIVGATGIEEAAKLKPEGADI